MAEVFKVRSCSQQNQSQSWNRGYFWCPGCQQLHAVNIDENRPPEQPTWQFDGNIESPTLTPDVRVTLGVPKNPEDPQTELFNAVCHSQISSGKIKFAKDCTAHSMANKIMPLPPLPDWVKQL